MLSCLVLPLISALFFFFILRQLNYHAAAAAPFTDQFMALAWPKGAFPWATIEPSRSLEGRNIVRYEGPHVNRFACGVPGCNHRFSLEKLLNLHLRMGHSEFDRERMISKREEAEGTLTSDGLSLTAPICEGGNARWGILRSTSKTAFYRVYESLGHVAQKASVAAECYCKTTGKCIDGKRGSFPSRRRTIHDVLSK